MTKNVKNSSVNKLDVKEHISQLKFSKEINVRINYSFFIIILNFLFFPNLSADFFKFFKCRLFNKNSRKSTENVWEQ